MVCDTGSMMAIIFVLLTGPCHRVQFCILKFFITNEIQMSGLHVSKRTELRQFFSFYLSLLSVLLLLLLLLLL